MSQNIYLFHQFSSLFAFKVYITHLAWTFSFIALSFRRAVGAGFTLPVLKKRKSDFDASFRASAHTGVGIRFPAPPWEARGTCGATRDADCHTSDIGHWFAMTHRNSCGGKLNDKLEFIAQPL